MPIVTGAIAIPIELEPARPARPHARRAKAASASALEAEVDREIGRLASRLAAEVGLDERMARAALLAGETPEAIRASMRRLTKGVV